MLEGLQQCFCTQCKLRSLFPTCPGFRFYGPRNTFYAHARYLVMASRRFYCKKHCFIHVLQQPSQKTYPHPAPILVVYEFVLGGSVRCHCRVALCSWPAGSHFQLPCFGWLSLAIGVGCSPGFPFSKRPRWWHLDGSALPFAPAACALASSLA